MSKITRDCQKGGPPITASKCMIIMKICTSVTSILIRYKKPKKKKKAKLFKAISSQLFASSAAQLCHAQYKHPKRLRKRGKTRKSLRTKMCLVLLFKWRAMLCYTFVLLHSAVTEIHFINRKHWNSSLPSGSCRNKYSILTLSTKKKKNLVEMIKF